MSYPKQHNRIPVTLICTKLRCGKKVSAFATSDELGGIMLANCLEHGMTPHIITERAVVARKAADNNRLLNKCCKHNKHI